MKFLNPSHAIAQRTPLLSGTPLEVDIYPGLTYVIALRGTLTGSTFTLETALRNTEDGETIDGSEILVATFDPEKESTLVTTGDRLIVTRTWVGEEGDTDEDAPALTFTMINVALSPLA